MAKRKPETYAMYRKRLLALQKQMQKMGARAFGNRKTNPPKGYWVRDLDSYVSKHGSKAAAVRSAQKRADAKGRTMDVITEGGTRFWTVVPKRSNPPKGWIQASAVKITRNKGKVVVQIRRKKR